MSYEVMQRPQQINIVKTSMNLLSLNYLDIKEQQMSITAYFHFVWEDSRLSWKSNDTYTNIRFLFSSELSVWTPAIIIENSVDDIDVISKPNVPMRIMNKGVVAWMPAGIFTTHCESDITYWPLDTQTCDVILSSWAYTANEVALVFDDKVIVMTFYKENGEWEILGKRNSSLVAERESETFSRLVITVILRRRPLFHMLNTLFPVVLMGFLTVVIFKLSPESGERVGLALTILLAYAVYLSLISESIPQTSMSASLLSAYLAAILLLQTVAVLLTVIYLDIYFTPEDKPMPPWLQFMTSSCISTIKNVHCCRKGQKRVQQPPRMVNNDENRYLHNANVSIGMIQHHKKKADPIEVWINEMDAVKQPEVKYTWKTVALRLDKVTMYVYLVLVTGLTTMCMGIMIHHYKYSYAS